VVGDLFQVSDHAGVLGFEQFFQDSGVGDRRVACGEIVLDRGPQLVG
jgi:hypothetical protein